MPPVLLGTVVVGAVVVPAGSPEPLLSFEHPESSNPAASKQDPVAQIMETILRIRHTSA
jgi:hypothetical protein